MPINFFKQLANQNSGHMLRITPPEHLKEIIEGFYVFKAGCSAKRELFFNDGYPVVVFMQNTHQNVKISVDGHTECVGNAWVCGGVLRNVYGESQLQFDGCLVIRFHAVTFFQLFDIKEDCFQAKQVFNFSKIAGKRFKVLEDAYYQHSSLENRMKVVVKFLSEKMSSYSYPKVLVEIQKLINRQGNLTVKDVLDDYTGCINYKWLERNFKKHLGTSPQSYILMRRFLNAYIALDASTSKDLLQIAINNGYYDDNHLIKDFRRFAGSPPKTYFKEQFRP
jgi:AraC-like DNA-binding protein